MLDLLAAIVSADPPAMLAWLVLAFAAGMYPVGIMLGAECSPCCNPCSLCTEGQLPDTLTVTFNGLQDQTPGPDLCLLTFSAPYGSGAAGKVTAPGGDPATDKGPITAVSLTNGGSGYAKLGRVAPTITASGGSGTGATFTVQTSKTTDANGIPSWSVTGVTLTGTTSGYVDGDQITFEVANGDTAEQGAAATIHTIRTAPTVTASVSGGTGASLAVTISPNGTTPQTWSVTGVTVANGGTGYPASGAVTFNVASGDSVEQPAYATFYCGRVEPTVTASVSGSAGSGAVLTPTLTQGMSWWDGRPIWQVDSVTIDDGGSGYSEGEYVVFSSPDGDGYGYGVIGSVDENGAITSVYAYYTEFYKSNGVIESVDFGYYSYGGIYYRDAGEISSISVEAGGKYYREDASEPPYVATVTVGVAQTAPSSGTGATFTATVEDDTGSVNFGKITGVTVGNGGNNYLAYELLDTCLSRFDGRSIVCQRSTANPCQYIFQCQSSGDCAVEHEIVGVEYRGQTTPLLVSLVYMRHNGLFTEGKPILAPVSSATMTADENAPNCSLISVTCTGGTGVPAGATAEVSTGGTYEQTATCRSISDEDLAAIQITIEWDGKTWVATRSPYPPDIPCQNQPGSANWNPFAISLFEGCGMASAGGFQAGAQCEPWKFHVIQCNGGGLGVKGCDLQWYLGDMACQYTEQVPSWPFTLVKYCDWRHKIVHVPTDEEGYPSGDAVIIRDEASDSFVGSGCEYPGLPSVSFSRLP